MTTTSSVSVAGKGTVTIAANGSYVFVPVPCFSGPVEFAYTVCDNGSPTACANATLYILVTPFNTDPDINATFVNVPVPGNAHTNDDVPVGSTYGTAPPLSSSPSGSTTVVTMNPDGTYVFTGDVPGVYVYDVQVCAPGATPPCGSETLTITVTAPLSNANPPVANTDIATTPQGVPVTLNTLSNDNAGNAGGTLDPSSVAIVPGTQPNPTTEGSLTASPTTGLSLIHI